MNPNFGLQPASSWNKYDPTPFLNGLSHRLHLGNITSEPGHQTGPMTLFHSDGTPKGSLALQTLGEDTVNFRHNKDGSVKPPGFWHKAKRSILSGLGLDYSSSGGGH